MPFNSLEERFSGLEASNRDLTDEIRKLSEALINVHELTKKHQILDAKSDRIRRNVRATTLAFAIVLPLLTLGLYATLVDHVDDLFDDFNATRYQGCVDRNAATIENARRERALADAEDNAAIRAIHQQSAKTLDGTLVDCSVYRVSSKN